VAQKNRNSKSKSVLKNSHFSGVEFLIYVAAFSIIGLFTLWVSFAAPHNSGGKGGKYTGTLTLQMVADQNGDGLPNWNDTITFNETTNYTDSGGAGPWINASCHQNGVLVWSYTFGYGTAYPWPDSRNVSLSTGAWTSGAADCTAQLVYSAGNGRYPTITTLSFHVNA
jgi:hypothetical protein